MKAAVLNAFGSPLAIEVLTDPAPGAGSVVVDIVAAGVTGYAANIFNGSRNYALELPVAPGARAMEVVRTNPLRTRSKQKKRKKKKGSQPQILTGLRRVLMRTWR